MIDPTEQESAINLLVVDSSFDDTEKIVTALRNSGIPVHANRISEEDAYSQALAANSMDMVLISCDRTGIELDQAMNLYKKSRIDAPLILLAGKEKPKELVQALKSGARDTVPQEDLDRLQIVMSRELQDLAIRRKLASMEQKLNESENRCAALIDSSRDAIAYVHEGMHIYANVAYLEAFGFIDFEDIEGLPMLDMISPEHHSSFKEALRTFDPKATSASEIELACRKNDGEEFNAKLELRPAQMDGEPCTQIIIRRGSSSPELEEQIALLSHRDIQTGLTNRPFFMSRLEEIIRKITEPGSMYTLFYITLDNFAEIRGTAGISASDALLKEVADLLQSMTGDNDVLARFGDHTFSLLTSRTDRPDVEHFARNIITTVADNLYKTNTKMVLPSSSIGIALPEPGIRDAQDFINRAYNACESARLAGSGQFSVFSPAVETKAEEPGTESNIAALVRNALENDKFRLAYQPIVSLQGDSRENYAVLVRLTDDNGDEMKPEFFVEQAINTGKAVDIDRWVIRHAIAELVEQRNSGRKVNFFISLFEQSLSDEGMLLWICDCLREFKAKGAWLSFQIRDSAIRGHLQEAKTLIEGLKKIGCAITVDHFGTNPKPEGLLRHLPVDFVKLSPSFMKELASNSESQNALSAVNKAVQAQNVKTIATYVEDANSLAILWTLGVSYIQGYFLQEPSESISFDFNSV